MMDAAAVAAAVLASGFSVLYDAMDFKGAWNTVSPSVTCDGCFTAFGDSAMVTPFATVLCLPTLQPVISWNDSKS